MVLPDGRSIYWKGYILKNRYSYRNDIAYIPQIAYYPENLTVRELLKLIAGFRKKSVEADRLIDIFRLNPFLNKRMGTLSGGTRQKVSIVQAFMLDCDLYIMDEPTTGLDPLALSTFKELVEELVSRGKTVLLTTHIMSLVEELASEIIYLLDGKVYFQGAPAALKAEWKADTIEKSIARILSDREDALTTKEVSEV